MLENLIEYCCRSKFIVIAAFVALTAGGYYVMRRTPVDAIPDLSENQVIVFTDWMGRSPKEIEEQITYPLSVNLQGLAGVRTIRASSEFNFSMINIIFDDSTDFYFARTRVLERLALASTFLPQGVVPYLAPDATALGQIFWYTVEGDGRDMGELRALQDWKVRYQLNSVPGVAQVASVGGAPREYQIDVTPEKLRAFNVSLGEIYGAVARGNSAVGGRVVHKGNAEYLIRGVGWIRSVEDIRGIVIVERNGVPIRVGDVAAVQMGAEFRRSVLEKDGSEVVGGVVMMRYGENPLDVTQRIKEKIRELQKSLPEGVRIVPFYDRTRLIESSIETVTRVLEHEILIAAIAILLILTHVRSVLVIIVTLPLSILMAFILMKYWPWGSISSNIMSLSGIAISIGILVDQSIVMLENATHRLSQHFGDRPVRGDTTEIVVGALRQVGRPIFFSVVIMVISFLPVFALTGQEGKFFHPLAFTKTFALIGTAIISVTLVPAIIPLLIRGRLSKEEHNWIVRSVIAMYRPVLTWLMDRPRMVLWLFVILVSVGLFFARHLGREFMPPLDEGSIMDMPVTSPRASVTETADDLKARDALLRALPEIESIVGKSGRAETATDPSPLDMVETVINLRPKEHWLKRAFKLGDALKEAERVAMRLEREGVLKLPAASGERHKFLEPIAQGALDRFDTAMRGLVTPRQLAFDTQLAEESIRFVAGRVFGQLSALQGWTRPLGDEERKTLEQALVNARRQQFLGRVLVVDVEELAKEIVARLRSEGRLDPDLTDAFAPVPSLWRDLAEPVEGFFSGKRTDFHEQTAAALEKFRLERGQAWAHDESQRLYYQAVAAFERALLSEFAYTAEMQKAWDAGAAKRADVDGTLREQFTADLGTRAFFWHKTKADVVRELNTFVRVPGWANIWTQPIINRVDMLATGVRTQIGILVYGKTPQDIQDVSNAVADLMRGIPGAADVVADQTVGKGYIEVEVDRERAARYGVNVGDVQDTIEVALGGKTVTTTVEGRERYPVRLRYARDYRVDEESVRRILVASSSGSGAMGGGDGVMGTGPAAMGAPAPKAPKTNAVMPAVYLSDVATVKVVEGPVMIKSENGELRSYVQLNVRDRDIVGFVEEAQRLVEAKIKLPVGSHLGWSGQFEHQVRARQSLTIVFPAVLILIFVILYLTYSDFAHALLMMMAVPGALAGGVIFQTLFGYNFSVAVWVGYIACFGMATETGIIMLVYLRAAIEERGGLAKIADLGALREATLAGAIHRLRPKLLTEGTAIVGLAPMLWASGSGAEVIAPMAAPVLGGLLIADEVIDAFLPVLFCHVEAWRWLAVHREAELPDGLWIPFWVAWWIQRRRRTVA
jgi:Cu(I)/Ag(I) efflux system membrane protein CusA/SilA